MSKLSKNIFYNVIGKSLLLILNFIAVKYIFRRLGEDAFGLIFFITMLNTLLSTVLEIGVSATTAREISSYYRDEPVYIHQLIRTISLFYWGIYILIGLIICFIAPILVAGWVNLETMDEETAIYILRILSVASFMVLPKSFYASLFQGLERMEFTNVIDVGVGVLRHSGIIILLVVEGTLYQTVYWLAITYFLEVLVYQVLLIQFFSASSFVPGYCKSVIKRNFSFASNMTLNTLALAAYQQLDKAIISKLMPIGLLGYYGLAERATMFGGMLTHSVILASYPRFSGLFKNNNNIDFMNLYRKLQDFVCFGNVPILAFIPFGTFPIFSFVLNKEASDMLYLPTTLLCLGTYLNCCLRMPVTAALAMGRAEIIRNANFYSIPVVLPLTIVFIYYFGLIGAALGLLLRILFFCSYAIPRICAECLNIPVLEWYRHLLRVLIAVGFTYGMAWIAITLIDNYSVTVLSFAYIGATIIFLITSYLMIGEELKLTVLSQFLITKRRILALV